MRHLIGYSMIAAMALLALQLHAATPATGATAPAFTLTDQNGKSMAIVELPMPAPVVFEGRRLPASYANFYIANGIVLVPVFNDPNDRVALDILADLFPDREVTGIYSGDLIWGFGALHCMTQQQPGI